MDLFTQLNRNGSSKRASSDKKFLVIDFLVVKCKLEYRFSIKFKSCLRWRAFTMSVATVANYENVHLEFEVEDLTDIQAVSDVSCILMEIDKGLMLLRIFLFDEPAMKCKLILSDNPNIFVYHIAFTWVPICFRIVFRVSEGLIGCIRNV